MKLFFLLPFLFYNACANPNDYNETKPKSDKEKYWYNGEAEITSYKLSQARYGEIHEGQAVMIFVTEPFSEQKMTKSDNASTDDISVLKLNFTKKFYTGIYPYSMMTSTFFPFSNSLHSIKVSSSTQEWCGQTYMELQNKGKFEIDVRSYFENESGKRSIAKNLLEDDLWSKIRLDPDHLPEGSAMVIPSFFYLQLGHEKAEALECTLTKGKVNTEISSYTIKYREVDRTINIKYQTSFPHKILGWDETSYSGYGSARKKLTTTAELQKSIKTDYWTKNSVADGSLRDDLDLK